MTAAGRPSVTEDARAEAQRRWPGALGGKDAVPRRAFIAGAEWAAARAETTTGAIARGEALAAGDPDWMNVTRWPRTEAEATTVILRLIEENRNLRTTVDADLEYQRRLEARLAAVEALAAETIEDAARVINEVLGGDMDNHARIAAHRLADAGLLATARTRPTLSSIAGKLADEMGCERTRDASTGVNFCTTHHVGWLSDADQCARAERLADAVLALLRGGA